MLYIWTQTELEKHAVDDGHTEWQYEHNGQESTQHDPIYLFSL